MRLAKAERVLMSKLPAGTVLLFTDIEGSTRLLQQLGDRYLRLLANHPWPQGVRLGVRVGVHTGEPTRSAGDYAGLDVHRRPYLLGRPWWTGSSLGGSLVSLLLTSYRLGCRYVTWASTG
jgi:class 3 adenylate cyclase